MSLPALKLLTEEHNDVRHAVRRLRWFRKAFFDQVASVSREVGTRFEVDTIRLAGAFFAWSREFERLKPANPADRRRFVDFAAGLMLRELIAGKVLTAQGGMTGPTTQATKPQDFWPEGYVSVAFCLNVHKAVLRQDFGEAPQLGPAVDDLRHWMSFRENAAQDRASVIAFFGLFAGAEPNWDLPDVFKPSPAPRARQQSPRLRVVHGQQTLTRDTGSTRRADWAKGVNRVIVDLSGTSNLDQILYAEVTKTLGISGLDAPAETVRTLVAAPMCELMTHIALQSRTICTDRFARAYHYRLRERLARDLQFHSAMGGIFQCFQETSVATEFAVTDPKLALDDFANCEMPIKPAGLLLVEREGQDGPFQLSPLQPNAADQTQLFVSADPAQLAIAKQAGLRVLNPGQSG